MARLRSGILGNVRGKVSGVVGGQWKDINYIREYVKPANPNTVSQQAQRGKMIDCVAFCKPLVGPVFNAYTDKFQKSMSGFNRFIKDNVAEFDDDVDYSALTITSGTLFSNPITAAGYNNGTGACVITWDEDLGNNGALTDKVFGIVYDTDTGLWAFATEEETRDDEMMTVTCLTGLTATNLEVWIWCARKNGAIVELISSASHFSVTE